MNLPLRPGREGIKRECIEIAALAQAMFASAENFETLPLLKGGMGDTAEQLLIEKALAVAVKTRFLDDQDDLLASDRKNLLIGRYYESGVPKDEMVSVRLALNKIVHHKTLSVVLERRDVHLIADVVDDFFRPPTFCVPAGSYKRDCALVTVTGTGFDKKEWRFEIDVFVLIDEILLCLSRS